MLQIARISWVTITTLLLAGNVMAVEEAKYSVLRQEDGFELRQYESHILAETTVDKEFEYAGNEGFGRLFKYISGNNKQQQKIAMTSPVGQEPSSQKIAMTAPVQQQLTNNSWRVNFVMPSEYNMEDLPKPKNSKIELKNVPVKRFVIIEFSGTSSDENLAKHEKLLLEFIKTNNIISTTINFYIILVFSSVITTN